MIITSMITFFILAIIIFYYIIITPLLQKKSTTEYLESLNGTLVKKSYEKYKPNKIEIFTVKYLGEKSKYNPIWLLLLSFFLGGIGISMDNNFGKDLSFYSTILFLFVLITICTILIIYVIMKRYRIGKVSKDLNINVLETYKLLQKFNI